MSHSPIRELQARSVVIDPIKKQLTFLKKKEITNILLPLEHEMEMWWDRDNGVHFYSSKDTTLPSWKYINNSGVKMTFYGMTYAVGYKSSKVNTLTQEPYDTVYMYPDIHQDDLEDFIHF